VISHITWSINRRKAVLVWVCLQEDPESNAVMYVEIERHDARSLERLEAEGLGNCGIGACHSVVPDHTRLGKVSRNRGN